MIDVDFHGSKIGGSIDDAIVLIPDPMGATGSTVIEVIRFLQSQGKPKKIISMNFISTPNFFINLGQNSPDTLAYTLRLDSAAGDNDGLNQNSYIIPGAGGLGEIINNSFC